MSGRILNNSYKDSTRFIYDSVRKSLSLRCCYLCYDCRDFYNYPSLVVSRAESYGFEAMA